MNSPETLIWQEINLGNHFYLYAEGIGGWSYKIDYDCRDCQKGGGHHILTYQNTAHNVNIQEFTYNIKVSKQRAEYFASAIQATFDEGFNTCNNDDIRERALNQSIGANLPANYMEKL